MNVRIKAGLLATTVVGVIALAYAADPSPPPQLSEVNLPANSCSIILPGRNQMARKFCAVALPEQRALLALRPFVSARMIQGRSRVVSQCGSRSSA